MKKHYELLVFDLDGTLVDTAPDIVSTVEYIIEKYGFEPKDSAFIASCIGGGARNVLLKSLGEDKAEQIDCELLPVFKQYYLENCDKNSKLYDGVKEILTYYQQMNKKLAVATFKVRNATEKILKTLGIDAYFDCIITADDVENPKPHPECIHKILEGLKVPAEKTLLIGDTKTDYMTGRNAEVDVCAVSYGYGEESVLSELKPMYFINKLSKMKKIIF